MIRSSTTIWMTCLQGLFGIIFMTEATAAETLWRFSVFLDEDPVGYHQFQVKKNATQLELKSEAHFNVKILMINAYSYQHESDETWNGNCLQQISAKTDDNGTQTLVTGGKDSAGFIIQRGQNKESLPSCIMTFAYWNPTILDKSQLLNPQTGEYTHVKITKKGLEKIKVKGTLVDANHYHLESDKFKIDLWYNPNGDWLALDSHLDNGHDLKYRLE